MGGGRMDGKWKRRGSEVGEWMGSGREEGVRWENGWEVGEKRE